ncbi:MAG: IS110 family transposase [Actinomycetota bacterium]
MVERWCVVGCDAHKQTLTLAAVDAAGSDVKVASFSNDPDGFGAIVAWLRGLGIEVIRVGVEGSSSWGRHLSVSLATAGYDVREVPPTRTTDRRHRRRRPKTDREDALAVARETLADSTLPPAKPTLDVSEAQGELTVVCERRRSLIRRRQRLLNEAEGLLNKLPPELIAGMPKQVAPRLRKVARLDRTLLALSPSLAEMLDWLAELTADLDQWEARIGELEDRLPPLLDSCGSTLAEEFGIGVVSASELVAAVGDPSRFKTEGGFARWCGVAPVAVSSGEGDGQPIRHRLDLLGNRQVNRILYTMSVTQARHLPSAKEFLARKRAEGKSKKEARRAHKRQLAKRVIRRMWADQRRQRAVLGKLVLEPSVVVA